MAKTLSQPNPPLTAMEPPESVLLLKLMEPSVTL